MPNEKQINTITEYLENWKDQIIQNMVKAGHNSTGSMAESFEVVKTEKGAQLEAFKFYQVLETGRRPGKMPPPSALIPWIKSKSFISTLKVESLAYVIARAIGREGTKLWQQGGRKDIFTSVLTESNLNKLLEVLATEEEIEIVRNLNIEFK